MNQTSSTCQRSPSTLPQKRWHCENRTFIYPHPVTVVANKGLKYYIDSLLKNVSLSWRSRLHPGWGVILKDIHNESTARFPKPIASEFPKNFTQDPMHPGSLGEIPSPHLAETAR